MVKLVAMIMGDTGRMNCWKTTSAQYPTAHFMAIANLLWTIISAKSSPIKASSSQKVWGRKAMTLAPISSHNPARGSNMRCSVSISHQAGFLKVLAEHGPGNESSDDGAHNGCQEQHHQHDVGGKGCQGIYIVRRHPLLRDLLQELIPHEPDRKWRTHHAHREQHKGYQVSGHAPVMGKAPDEFRQAASNDKGNQDHHGKLSGDIVDEAGDEAHQEDRAYLLYLGAHHEIWNAGKQGDEARHQNPQQRMQPAQEHEGEVDDEVNGRENSYGNDIFAAHPAALHWFRHNALSFS